MHNHLHENLYNNWYRHVGGGVNTDNANTDLGAYFKFNEGIVADTSYDSVVLDYSGRIANGTWYGYSSGARSTNSAFEESGLVTSEVKDPIIYAEHPEVKSVLSELQKSGSHWDLFNPSYLYNTVPNWIQEEDEENGDNNIKYLYQIIASYFDTLYCQISNLPNIQNISYPSASYKPLPFADKLLTNRGLVAPDIFVNSSILERFGD